MSERAIADTSTLIALEKINLLDVLCKIYTEIILPEAVINEFGTPSIDCYSVKKVEGPLVRLLASDLNLSKGESEVITLSNETGIRTIIDDLKARKVAERLGLNVTGTIGILLKAEEMGLIESAYNKAKELKDIGFHVSDELLKDISKFKRT
jgi:predicted nucleic acid-binding protein